MQSILGARNNLDCLLVQWRWERVSGHLCCKILREFGAGTSGGINEDVPGCCMIWRQLEFGNVGAFVGMGGAGHGSESLQRQVGAKKEEKQFRVRENNVGASKYYAAAATAVLHCILQGIFSPQGEGGPLYSLNNLTLGPLDLSEMPCKQCCDPTHQPRPRAHIGALPSFLAG